jgi:hypothetical protein
VKRWNLPRQPPEQIEIIEQFVVDPPQPGDDPNAVLTARRLTVVDAIHYAYWDAEAEGRDPVAAAGRLFSWRLSAGRDLH